MKKTKKLAVGILAHVDAGKTTLAEGILNRPDPESRKSGSQGRLSGHGGTGKSKGYHDLFQTGRAEAERDGGHTP